MIKGSDAFDFTTVEGESDVMAGFAAKYSLRPVQSEKIYIVILVLSNLVIQYLQEKNQPATWLSKAYAILLSKFVEVLLFHLSQKLGEISTIRVTMHFGVDPDVFNLLISHVVAGRTMNG
jgi:hypothetical protein